MNKNWRTNIGGAVGTIGTALLGVGLVPQLMGLPSKWLTGILVAGLILSAAGKGLTAFFAADATVVNNVANAVDTINQGGANPMAAPAVSQPTETKV